MVKNEITNVVSGVRMKVFDYTSKNIHTISKEKQAIHIEVCRVKCLTREQKLNEGWAGYHKRPFNCPHVWANDDITYLKKIGKKTYKKMNELGNISKIHDLQQMNPVEIEQLGLVCNIPTKRIKEWVNLANNAEEGTSPYPIPFDWIEEAGHGTNPYLHRYGVENWISEVVTSSKYSLKQSICVKELVKHIDRETGNVYKGTQYENTYMWSHDALKQMTDKVCIEWMKQEGYWKRWIKPELGLNDFIEAVEEDGSLKKSKNYANRPVGNQPELMPLDNSLNWDIDTSNDLHVLLTDHLPKTDPRKFCKSTPKEISRSIARLYDPVIGVVPCSRRIVQDCTRVITSLKSIVAAGGAIVPGLANRNGHRKDVGIGDRRRYFPKKDNVAIPTLSDYGIFHEVQEVANEYFEKLKDDFRRNHVRIGNDVEN